METGLAVTLEKHPAAVLLMYRCTGQPPISSRAAK
jgi:hypothetical protein